MASATVTWTGKQTFIGTDSTQHSVVLSTPSDGIGMKPSEMMLVALAACTSVDVVDILQKKRMDLKGHEVRVTAVQDTEPPWTFRKIHMIYRMFGDNLTEKAVEQAIRLSEEKYCSVASTLREVAEITWEYQINPQD